MSFVGWSSGAKSAFGLYVAFNSFFGLWPLVRVDLQLKIRMSITVVELIIMVTCICYEMTQNCGDAEDFLDSLVVMSGAVISLSKLILCHIHRDKLIVNITSSIQDWSSNQTINYRSVMAKNARIYKIFTYLYGTALFSDGILHCLNVLFFSSDKFIGIASNDEFQPNVTQLVLKKRYPFPSTCTLNDVSDTVYLIILSNQLIQTLTVCAIIVGSDTIFFALTAHLCGQFEILKMKFANIGSDSSLSMATANRKNMITLISTHQQLLSRIELLEEAYNKIILIQLIMDTTVTSAAGFGFVMAMKTSNSFASVKSFVVMQSSLLQSFMYSTIGEALHSASDDILQSVYDGSWYELPRYWCKDILFIMMRLKVSPCLTAGKFFYMTHATFMKIVKITFSYISALQLMLDE